MHFINIHHTILTAIDVTREAMPCIEMSENIRLIEMTIYANITAFQEETYRVLKKNLKAHKQLAKSIKRFQNEIKPAQDVNSKAKKQDLSLKVVCKEAATKVSKRAIKQGSRASRDMCGGVGNQTRQKLFGTNYIDGDVRVIEQIQGGKITEQFVRNVKSLGATNARDQTHSFGNVKMAGAMDEIVPFLRNERPELYFRTDVATNCARDVAPQTCIPFEEPSNIFHANFASSQSVHIGENNPAIQLKAIESAQAIKENKDSEGLTQEEAYSRDMINQVENVTELYEWFYERKNCATTLNAKFKGVWKLPIRTNYSRRNSLMESFAQDNFPGYSRKDVAKAAERYRSDPENKHNSIRSLFELQKNRKDEFIRGITEKLEN